MLIIEEFNEVGSKNYLNKAEEKTANHRGSNFPVQ